MGSSGKKIYYKPHDTYVNFPICQYCEKLNRLNRYIRFKNGCIFIKPQGSKDKIEYLEWIRNIVEEDQIDKIMDDLNEIVDPTLFVTTDPGSFFDLSIIRFCERCGRTFNSDKREKICPKCLGLLQFKSRSEKEILEFFRRQPEKKITVLKLLNRRDELELPQETIEKLSFNELKKRVEKLHDDNQLHREGQEGFYKYYYKI